MQRTSPSVTLACPKCKGDVFELRMLKDEGVAAVRCVACQRHFLLLDSGDYWLGMIQSGYPRLTTCSCKGDAFRIQLDYRLRQDGDAERAVPAPVAELARVQSGLLNSGDLRFGVGPGFQKSGDLRYGVG